MKMGEENWIRRDTETHNYWRCPSCGFGEVFSHFKFCPDCGEKIEWEWK